MPNPVVHFEIMGNDSASSQKWYSEVFGWKIDPMPIPGAPESQTVWLRDAPGEQGYPGRHYLRG